MHRISFLWRGLIPVLLLAGAFVLWGRSERRQLVNANPSERGEVVESLADLFVGAERHFDCLELDFGTEKPCGKLVRGWSWNETWPGGGTANWAVERVAELSFPLMTKTPRTFALWVGGPPDLDSPQQMTVSLNGMVLARLTIPQGLALHEFSAPASALRVGQNQLVFEFAVLSPLIHARRLAAVFDKLIIKPANAADAARIPRNSLADFQALALDVDGSKRPVLRQPSSSRLELSLLPRSGAELRFFRPTRTDTNAVVTASVSVCQELRTTELCRPVLQIPAPLGEPTHWEEARVSLPALERGATRLRFEVSGAAPSPSRPAFHWGEPRVVSDPLPGQFRLQARPAPQQPSPRKSEPLPPVRHVVVYLVDTLRADMMLQPDAALPNFHRFARESIWFPNGFAATSWTKASTASLLTSLFPWQHGAQERLDRIRRSALLLPQWLEQNDVFAAGFIGNGNVGSEFGFATGFRVYRQLFTDAPKIHEAALDWLRGVLRAGDVRTFTYIHVIDPHDPYSPQGIWKRLFDLSRYTGLLTGSTESMKELRFGVAQLTEHDRRHLLDLYRAEIRQLDTQFGDLIEGLRTLGMLDSTAILVVSDHGEEFEEHGGWLHGSTLEPEQTQIPFFLRLPGGKAGRVYQETPVSLYDVGPTVCNLFGLEAPPAFVGGVIRGDAEPSRQMPVIQALDLDGEHRLAAIGPDWAYSFGVGVNHDPRLYARLEDPGHQRNLATGLPTTSAAIEQWVRRVHELTSQGYGASEALSEKDLDPATLEQLKALGYLGQ